MVWHLIQPFPRVNIISQKRYAPRDSKDTSPFMKWLNIGALTPHTDTHEPCVDYLMINGRVSPKELIELGRGIREKDH